MLKEGASKINRVRPAKPYKKKGVWLMHNMSGNTKINTERASGFTTPTASGSKTGMCITLAAGRHKYSNSMLLSEEGLVVTRPCFLMG